MSAAMLQPSAGADGMLQNGRETADTEPRVTYPSPRRPDL